jgi:hypothetical protein
VALTGFKAALKPQTRATSATASEIRTTSQWGTGRYGAAMTSAANTSRARKAAAAVWPLREKRTGPRGDSPGAGESEGSTGIGFFKRLGRCESPLFWTEAAPGASGMSQASTFRLALQNNPQPVHAAVERLPAQREGFGGQGASFTFVTNQPSFCSSIFLSFSIGSGQLTHIN